MPALPTPVAPDAWGTALNNWLLTGHNADGTIKLAGLPASVMLTDTPQTVTGVKLFSPTNPATTLNGGIDAVVTTISVASASGFANPGPFTILVDFEKMRVTGGYGTTTWTVTRAYDQTQAATHSNGAVVAGIYALQVGTGDDVFYALGGRGVARVMDIRQGTAGSPNTEGLGPTFKVSRTDSIPEANMPLGVGANLQGNAAIWAASTGDVNQQASTNALMASAVSVSTQNTHNDDAQGIGTFGSVEGSGTGAGIGLYASGKRTSISGGTNAIEARSANFTAQDDPYLTTTASATMGVWATASGNASSAVAYNVGAFGSSQKWHVGYAAILNSVLDYFARDDSGATNGILLAGARSGYGMAIASGSGPLLVGETTALSASSLLEVISASGTSKDPLARFGSVGASDSFSLRLHNNSGTVYFAFVSGGSGLFLTGTVAGDSGVKVSTAAKAYHIGGTAKVVTVTGGDLLGFYAATPVARPASANEAAVVTTASTQTTPWGFSTQAQADSIVTLVNQLRADLVSLGLIKGAA